MSANVDVTPNRRGVRSRELVLDAAERVMAEHGFEAATVARVVEEAGIPMSSVYHYFGSKEGILLAVMERGADRFFGDLPAFEPIPGPDPERLARLIATSARTLERHPSFLRLLIVFAVQPPATARHEIEPVVARVRELALERLRREIAIAFGDDPLDQTTAFLAHLALSLFDGAFVAACADDAYTLEQRLEPLAPALMAVRGWLRSDAAR